MRSWFRQTRGEWLRQERGVSAEGESVRETERGDRQRTGELTVGRPPTGEKRGSLSLRWTRIAGVEGSCGKESRRVSKKTGLTEVVQEITDWEARASRIV